MSDRIKNTAQLRAFLLDQMEGLANGKVSIEQGQAMVKLAGAVNASVAAEVNASRLMIESGKAIGDFGHMKLGRGEFTP